MGTGYLLSRYPVSACMTVLACSIESMEVTSSSIAFPWPPAWEKVWSASWAFSSLRAARKMKTPRFESSSAIAKPIPVWCEYVGYMLSSLVAFKSNIRPSYRVLCSRIFSRERRDIPLFPLVMSA